MNAPRALPIVQRPGRVGRHELDVDRARPDRGDATPGRRVGEDRRDDRLERAVAQAQVEEPGRRDLGRSRSAIEAGSAAASSRTSFGGERRARSPAAPCGTAGRASSRGCSRSRRARVGRTLDLDRRARRVVAAARAARPSRSPRPRRARRRRGPGCARGQGSRSIDPPVVDGAGSSSRAPPIVPVRVMGRRSGVLAYRIGAGPTPRSGVAGRCSDGAVGSTPRY